MGKAEPLFSCLYRSPSQTKEEFEEFCTDLHLLLSNVNDLNIPLSVITGDFNARSLKKVFKNIFDKLSNDIQVDRLCFCGSLVIDV